jgi:glutaminyl-peptide cyclotransferase
MRTLRGALALLGVWCLPVVASSTPVLQRATTAPVFRYQVVTSYPHDRAAFTQGLVYLDGFLYEGTGLKGQSTIRKVKLETGEVLQQRRIDDQYFGEGIAVWQNNLIQLTWQSEIGFVYDLATFEPSRRFTYKGEGWGLTHDGTRLIMSDGTPTLRFLDPATLEETGRVTVRDGKVPVDDLNELEFVKGEILANVWNTTRIARISPTTGQVTAWIDFSGLLSRRDAAGAEVMNGIAYDAARDRLFVTGKLWPRLFEVRIVEK